MDSIKRAQNFGNLPELAGYLTRDADKIANDADIPHKKDLLRLLTSMVDIYH